MSRHHHGKDFVLGAMIGSSLGALSAMIFTTKKGHKIQEEMADKYHEFEGLLKGYARGNKRKAKHAMRKIAKNINHKMKRAKKKILKAKKKIKS